MLQRVGQALSRLLKPINISESNLSKASLQHERGKNQNPSEQQSEEKGNQDTPAGFQRFNAPPAVDTTEGASLEVSASAGPPPAAPGLTTAFLNMLRQLQEKRKDISFGFGLRGYQDGQTIQKKSAKVRKGMVINESVE